MAHCYPITYLLACSALIIVFMKSTNGMVIKENEDSKSDNLRRHVGKMENVKYCQNKRCTSDCKEIKDENSDLENTMAESNKLVINAINKLIGQDKKIQCVHTCKCDVISFGYITNILPPHCKLVDVQTCIETCYKGFCDDFCETKQVQECQNISL